MDEIQPKSFSLEGEWGLDQLQGCTKKKTVLVFFQKYDISITYVCLTHSSTSISVRLSLYHNQMAINLQSALMGTTAASPECFLYA